MAHVAQGGTRVGTRETRVQRRRKKKCNGRAAEDDKLSRLARGARARGQRKKRGTGIGGAGESGEGGRLEGGFETKRGSLAASRGGRGGQGRRETGSESAAAGTNARRVEGEWGEERKSWENLSAKQRKALGEYEKKGGEKERKRGTLELIERKGKRMARRWCVWYGGVGGEDEAGMSIDSGCTRLKQSPFVAVPAATGEERGRCSPLLLETVNPQSCWMLLLSLSLSLSMPRSLKLCEFRSGGESTRWTGSSQVALSNANDRNVIAPAIIRRGANLSRGRKKERLATSCFDLERTDPIEYAATIIFNPRVERFSGLEINVTLFAH